MASSTTKPNTANAATTLLISPAPNPWQDLIPSAKPSWEHIGAGIRLSAVEAGQMSNSVAHGWQPIGAQQVKVQLDAGGTEKNHFHPGLSRKPQR